MMAASLRYLALATCLYQTSLVHSTADGAAKSHSSQLRDQYDFVVAGGGTSGLTLADRLAEAFPRSKPNIKPSPSPFPTVPARSQLTKYLRQKRY